MPNSLGQYKICVRFNQRKTLGKSIHGDFDYDFFLKNTHECISDNDYDCGRFKLMDTNLKNSVTDFSKSDTVNLKNSQFGKRFSSVCKSTVGECDHQKKV